MAGGLALTAIGTATDHAPASEPAAKPAPITKAVAAAAVSRLPTAFEPKGDGFLARGSGYQVFLDSRGATLALQHGKSRHPAILTSSLTGAEGIQPTSESRLRGVINEYGGPRSTWREGVPTFARVRYRSVYPGIDAVYHGRNGHLEYDFQIAPGADPRQIGLELSGARSLRVASNGDLVIRLSHGSIRQSRPVAYQQIAGRRIPVDARYRLLRGHIAFAIGGYDMSRPLVIDPVLTYATYFGGNSVDKVSSVGIGSDGSIFMAGGTNSTSVPGSAQRIYSEEDAFVTRIAPDGGSLIYTTILGSHSGNSSTIDSFADDQVNGMLVLGTNVGVVGGTRSQYPQTTGYPEDSLGNCNTLGSQNAFISFLGATGGLNYSSCFGGSGAEEAESIASYYFGGSAKRTGYVIAGNTASTDMSGGSSVAGFQNTSGGGTDGFLVQLAFDNNPTCVSSTQPCDFILWRTYIGGSGDEHAWGVRYDSSGYAVVTGDTTSANFPVSSGSALGGEDAWIARYGLSGSTNDRTYQLRYGGNGDDSARDIELDPNNNSHIVGSTTSTNLPATPGGGNLTRGGGTDGFIAKLDSGGSVLGSVYVGGTGEDSLNDLALQQNGSTTAEYAVGSTASGGSGTFAPRNTIPGQSCSDGNTQAFVVKRIVGASPEGAVIACMGGSGTEHGTALAVPSTVTDGTMFIAGDTTGGLSGVNGIQTSYAGGQDGFLAKLVQPAPSIDSGPAEGEVVGSSSVQFGLSTGESGMHFQCTTPTANQLVAGTRGTANCPGATASYTGLVDGSHTFEGTTVDDFGSESGPATRTFTVDTVAPDAFDLTAPAEGDTVATTQPTFTWGESHDTSGVSYSVVIDGQTIPTVTPASCSGGTCTAQAVGPVLDGPHTVKIVASDGATPANTRDSASTRNFTISDPVHARFSIAPNPALAGRTVTFDGSSSVDASHKITHYEWDLDGDGTFETDTGTTPTTSRVFFDPGTINVALRVTGDVGGTATTTQALKVNDPSGAAAQIGVSINDGAQYTNDPNVKLKVVAPAGASALLISNDGGFAGALPQPVKTAVTWKLDSSGPERLPKTVYVRFLVGPFASPNYTDDIILDERPPVVDSAAISGAPAAATAATAAKAKTWKVKVKAHDTNSGVGFVQVTASKKKPGKLIKYAKSVKAKSATRPKFLRARDRAGNYSKWRKLR